MYKYDATYQITGVKYGVSNTQDGYTAATGASRTVTYTYDAVGNRTQVVDASTTTNYTANNLNQYTAVGSNTAYSYSNRGDLTGDGTWTYGYDREERLISATTTGTMVTYKYDGVGRRIEKNVNGTVTKYVYSGQDLIEERDSSNTVTAKYVYAGEIDKPVKVIKGSEVYYFQQDALGNVTALVDASGDIFESYTYDVFGAPAIKDANGDPLTEASTPFLFTGREYDGEIGLYHYRTRAYSPELGRFLQPDSIGFAAEDVNLYRYVYNNPLNFNDPLGRTPAHAKAALAFAIAEIVGQLSLSFSGAVADDFDKCSSFECFEDCITCCNIAFGVATGLKGVGIAAAEAGCLGLLMIPIFAKQSAATCVAGVTADGIYFSTRLSQAGAACTSSCDGKDKKPPLGCCGQ